MTGREPAVRTADYAGTPLRRCVCDRIWNATVNRRCPVCQRGMGDATPYSGGGRT